VKFVVTAGPTRELIDPVRFLSNRSSGKMGYAVAAAAIAAGHEVRLISGPVNLKAPSRAEVLAVTTSDEMYDAVHAAVEDCDVLVMCAAIADYAPAKYSAQKLEKQTAPFALELRPTRDILSSLPKENRPYLVIGFAAETHDLEIHAQKKLRAKNCDMIVANNVSRADSGMESDENAIEIFCRNGERKKIGQTSKESLAHELIKIILNVREKCLTKKS
jgi:phosphopantothenoylcysteine decarboxylase/phosphopantothenate--cysteine ligase